MIEHIPVLLVVIPLVTALLTPLIQLILPKATQVVIKLALFTNFVLAVLGLRHVMAEGPWHYWLGNWEPPYGIEFVLDYMSATLVVVVTAMAFLVAVYARSFFSGDGYKRQYIALFYVLYVLMVTGVLGMSVAGDIFTMYVFIEITSISAYGLVAMGGGRATFAALRYLVMGTVAATFYLLGIGFLFGLTGSLNMAQLSQLVPALEITPSLIFSMVMIVVGLGIKCAMVPLHTWLPDAHTYGPTPAIAFLASAMLKAFAYGIFRFMYTIFGGYSHPVTSVVLTAMGWIAVLGIIYGSIMAIAQTDFRRLLAFSTIAQLSYIPLGISIGTPIAIAGAALQIISHSMTKGCLFMIKGALHLKLHMSQIKDFKGLYKKLPVTCVALVISAMSMIGLPPTSGFFVKWQLASGAAEAGKYTFIAVLIISGLLNAVYFFRLLEVVFFKDQSLHSEGHEEHHHENSTAVKPSFMGEIKAILSAKEPTAEDHLNENEIKNTQKKDSSLELPLSQLVPIIILMVGILVVGLSSGWLTENIFSFISLNGGAFI